MPLLEPRRPVGWLWRPGNSETNQYECSSRCPTPGFFTLFSGFLSRSKIRLLAILAMIGFTAPVSAVDSGFEQPGPVDAHRFLPQALLESRQHPSG
jgi:hypothetical protein